MILPDVDLLVLAHHGEMPRPADAHVWLTQVVHSDAAFGTSSKLVLSGLTWRDPLGG